MEKKITIVVIYGISSENYHTNIAYFGSYSSAHRFVEKKSMEWINQRVNYVMSKPHKITNHKPYADFQRALDELEWLRRETLALINYGKEYVRLSDIEKYNIEMAM